MSASERINAMLWPNQLLNTTMNENATIISTEHKYKQHFSSH
jgi:hypothetical protein